MSDTQILSSTQEKTDFFPHPLVWGVDEIAKVIGRTPRRQIFHILARGQLKTPLKVGGKWVANREALIRELSGA
jgi:hypothetical protein